MSRRHLIAVALAGCLTVALAACAQTLPGRPISVFADPFRVAGMPAVDGPTGLRPDAAPPTRDVTGSDGGEIDELAASAISDIEDFWQDTFDDAFDGRFRPISTLISWEADRLSGRFCGVNTYGVINAGFCYDDDTVGWDRAILLPALRDSNGEIAVTLVLAHEYGHAVQRQARLTRKGTPTLVAEQQADCLAGAYMRWVAEGRSSRFTLDTGDGLNHVLATVISFRDPLLSDGDMVVGMDEHGSAFERVSAFQFGFTDGASSCSGIDMQEIDQRRGDLPVLLPEDQTGELPITEESVRAMVEALSIVFSPIDPPELSFDAPLARQCRDARPSSPASYCPTTNTIVVDLPELEAMGTASHKDESSGLVIGDNTAYSALASRYMQAVQQQHGGLVLDNASAALRTACLTGVATTLMSEWVTTPEGNTISLTAGDVDEAVSGILTNGLVASDVNGDSVPSGFSRIDAFRVGVLGNEQRCVTRFP